MITRWFRGDGFVNWGLGAVCGFAIATAFYGLTGLTGG